MSLLQIPLEILTNVLDHLDFRSLLICRKVCRDFRNIIDDVVPSSSITEILIRINKNEFLFDSWIHRNSGLKSKIMERFEQNLKNRLRPLQVRTIDYGIINQKEMMTIFPFICTETLEKIVIGNSEGLGQKHLDINKIVKLEQWKKAKKVQFNEFFVSEPIRSFAHFSKVSISMDTVTTEIIKSLKEIFRDSPVMSYFEIYYNPSRYPQDLRSLFGHRFDGSFTDEDAGPRWFFKIPKNEIHVISVQSNLHSWLRLTRFKKEDLPGD
uniref:F-box domain-containing protein n=1 Tax=Caenorhabditis tropicalis TaxID=1561998 RepID=A0A1I7UWI9_9PELO